MGPFTTPLIRIENEGVVTQSMTKFIHLLEKPSLSIVCLKKDHSTLLSFAYI